METHPAVLLQTLEDLGDEDFKKFKWYLYQKGALEDLPAIPKGRLENANKMDTVYQMVQTYCGNVCKVVRMVLEKMNMNDLVEIFSKTISEPTGKSRRESK